MPNVDKIRETLAVARANQDRLDMRGWARGVVNLNAASWQECGVAFCLAGWRAVLDGLRPVADSRGYATGDFIDDLGHTWKAEDWAAGSMELDDRQSEDLFVMTQDVTNIDILDWVAEQIMVGNTLDDCEDCAGAGRYEDQDCELCAGRGFIVVCAERSPS